MDLSHSFFCIGSSHIHSGTPVQDRSAHSSILLPDGRTATLLALSDGHGSEAHFRSDIGAQLAVDAALEAMPEFIQQISDTPPQTSVRRGVAETNAASQDDITPVDSLHEDDFRRFFAKLGALWCAKVMEHIRQNPIDDTFTSSPARPYGCTLLGAAIVDGGMWMTFQLGDGLCAILDNDGRPHFPIPTDSRCFSNRTTSMCVNGAADFRYAYGTDIPAALMLCSDGLENCFDSHAQLGESFLIPLIEELGSKGMDAVADDIAASLPAMSADLSHDDMSIALWTTDTKAQALAPSLRAMTACIHTVDLQRASAELEECIHSIGQISGDISILEAVDADSADIIRKESVLATLRRRENELRDEIDHITNILKSTTL